MSETNRAPGQRKKWRDPTEVLGSPTFAAWALIVTTVIGLGSLVVLIITSVTGHEPDNLKVTLLTTVGVAVVLLPVSVFLLWRSERLSKEYRISSEEAEQLQKQLNTAEGVQSDLVAYRNLKEQMIADVFRDIAKARAKHSLDLFSLQGAILDRPELDKSLFEQSWERQKKFLDDYSTRISDLFTKVKTKTCCANIKVIWDFEKYSELKSMLSTEFGVDPEALPMGKAAYQAIARCETSFNRKRQDEKDQSNQRIVANNYIFRRIYQGGACFRSNDIAADIKKWKGYVAEGEELNFDFPDDETTARYSRLLVVPIAIKFEDESKTGFEKVKMNRLIGMLSIDSDESEVQFDNKLDLSLATQLSFDLASTFYEYFRCVRHLRFRLAQQDSNKGGT